MSRAHPAHPVLSRSGRASAHPSPHTIVSHSRPTTILCVSSYFKGQEFLRECRRLGCRVLLLTVEKLREADWPRESIDEAFYMPDLFRRIALSSVVPRP